jgi:glycosyltransferase involved in cell wall biosynthesis
MNKKLYLLTDSFPYGEGEKSFLIPELEYLKSIYDITIISCANSEARFNRERETKLDNIKVVYYNQGDINGIKVIKYLIPFVGDKETWKEMGRLFKSGKNILKRIKACLFFYANAYKLYKWMEQGRLLEEEALYYSYWYNHHVLGVVFSIVMSNMKNMHIITRAHGYDLYKEQSSCGWQPYKQYMDRYVDSVVFISQNGYDYYKKYFSLSENTKYNVCKLGTKKQEAVVMDTRVMADKKYFLLVSCSQLIPLKRVGMIIEGLSLIDNENIKWVHFGTGPLEEITKKLAEDKLDNKSNISYEFKGLVDNDDIMEYYRIRKPDCFITTSENEGSPVSIQEAIAFGMPIIGTKIGGIPEMISGNGILLPLDMQPCHVADAVKRLYNMEGEIYISMRDKSVKIWSEGYDREENLRKFTEIIEDTF